MPKDFTDRQVEVLRAVSRGAAAHYFDGRTVRSLYRLGLLDKGAVTPRGADLLAKREVPPQPMARAEGGRLVELYLAPRPDPAGRVALAREDAMAEICCEGFDEMVRAGVLVVGARGDVYISSGKRWWKISHCPGGCGQAK